MKITLTKAWKNSRTGERFAAGAELDLADAQAKKLIDAGYAIAVPDQTTETTVTNENASGETNPPIPETEPTFPQSNGVNSETNTVEPEAVSTETEPSPPPAEPAPSVPTDDDESRRMRRRREAYEAN
jgi:hypothetical protein